MDKNYYMPKYLDEPFRLVVFTFDELVAFGTPFVIGFVLNTVIIGLVLSIISILLWRKLKGDSKGYRFFSVLIYWYMPKLTTLRHFPSSFLREYLG